MKPVTQTRLGRGPVGCAFATTPRPGPEAPAWRACDWGRRVAPAAPGIGAAVRRLGQLRASRGGPNGATRGCHRRLGRRRNRNKVAIHVDVHRVRGQFDVRPTVATLAVCCGWGVAPGAADLALEWWDGLYGVGHCQPRSRAGGGWGGRCLIRDHKARETRLELVMALAEKRHIVANTGNVFRTPVDRGTGLEHLETHRRHRIATFSKRSCTWCCCWNSCAKISLRSTGVPICAGGAVMSPTTGTFATVVLAETSFDL